VNLCIQHRQRRSQAALRCTRSARRLASVSTSKSPPRRGGLDDSEAGLLARYREILGIIAVICRKTRCGAALVGLSGE